VLQVSVDDVALDGVVIPLPLLRNSRIRFTICEQSQPSTYCLNEFHISRSSKVLIKGSATIKNESVVLEVAPGCDGLDLSLVGERLRPIFSFANILTRFCPVDILIPLFAQLDLAIQDNACEFQASDAVSILQAFLMFDVGVQQRFIDNSGFLTISYLLQSVSANHITEHLYASFLRIFQDPRALHSLKYSLVDHILLNFAIWARAELSSQAKISLQWSHQLYLSFMPFSVEIQNFRALLFGLTDFFQCKDKDRAGIMVRQSIMEMAHFAVSPETFQGIDFAVLVGLCLQLRDSDEIFDLMS
jgi:hypothetical protein